jgi:phospholipase C
MAIGRRAFLIGASGAAATPPGAASTLRRSVARGSIMDVEHVVILMQENRSFDHYFGTLRIHGL